MNLAEFARGFSVSKYFKVRKKYYRSKSLLYRNWTRFRLIRMERRGGGFICLNPKEDIFGNSSPVFPHGLMGVVINANCKIGEGVTIYQGVIIVVKKHGDPNWPKIGNHVTIGANAIILGGVTIGDHSVIGAGCVVTKDVPPHSVVVSAPNRVFARD